jgi:hypothetical protein
MVCGSSSLLWMDPRWMRMRMDHNGLLEIVRGPFIGWDGVGSKSAPHHRSASTPSATVDKLTLNHLRINGVDLRNVHEAAKIVGPPWQVGRPTKWVSQPPLMAGEPPLLVCGSILRLDWVFTCLHICWRRSYAWCVWRWALWSIF